MPEIARLWKLLPYENLVKCQAYISLLKALLDREVPDFQVGQTDNTCVVPEAFHIYPKDFALT
jgi:hypothetical protein